MSALRDAVTVLHIELAEGGVVGCVHDHRDDVALTYPHPGLHPVAASCQHPGREHLRREGFGVGVEIPDQPLEICGLGSGSEGRCAPVVQQRAGEVGLRGRRQPFDDQLSRSQALLYPSGIRARGREERGLR